MAVPLGRSGLPDQSGGHARQLLECCYGVSRRTATADERVVQGTLPEDRLVSPFDSLFEQRVCNRRRHQVGGRVRR